MQINTPQTATAAAVLQIESASTKEYRSIHKVDQHSLIRARFLADSLIRDCRIAVETSKQVSGQRAVPSEKTVKELAVVLVFLLGLDEGGASGNEMILDFLFKTLGALDKLSPSPPSRRLVEQLGVYQAERICDRVCARAKVSEDLSQPAALVLRQSNVFEQRFRQDSLSTSLISAPEAIQAQLVLNQLSDSAA